MNGIALRFVPYREPLFYTMTPPIPPGASFVLCQNDADDLKMDLYRVKIVRTVSKRCCTGWKSSVRPENGFVRGQNRQYHVKMMLYGVKTDLYDVKIVRTVSKWICTGWE